MTEKFEAEEKNSLTNEEKSYIFKLEKFEGPLDLLMYLIKKAEIDIYDIPIHEITEQYLKYLSLMKKLDINVAAEFIIMAAKLMYIKSKMLLPVEADIEDEYFEDPRTELVQQLLEYQKFKNAAVELENKHYNQTNMFFRLQNQIKFDFDDNDNWVDVNIIDLLNIFESFLADSSKSSTEFYIPDTVTEKMKYEEIKELIKEKNEIDFNVLFDKEIKVWELVVTFMAILQLVRDKIIIIKQHKLFGDIKIFKRDTFNGTVH